MIREAVILAAGNGKRIKKGTTDPYILSTPKPLLRVRGKPMIERIVRKLDELSVKIVIVINPDDQKLFQEVLGKYKVTYSYQTERKGTAHAVFSARKQISEDLFLVCMGDDISDFEIKEILEADRPLIMGYEVDEVKEYGTIVLDENGFSKKVIEKELVGKGLANTGLYVMPKEFFDIFDSIRPNDKNGELYLTDAVSLLYEEGIPLSFKKMRYWKGINRLDDLESENLFDRSELNIRHAMISDLHELHSLLTQLSPSSSNKYWTDQQMEQLQRIIRDENVNMLIAEYHGEIVGTATLLIQNNVSHGGRPYGHIENVVIDRNLRGFGIGSILIEQLKNLAKESMCYKVILNCNTGNVNFYGNNGFKETGEVEMRIDLQ